MFVKQHFRGVLGFLTLTAASYMTSLAHANFLLLGWYAQQFAMFPVGKPGLNTLFFLLYHLFV